MRRPAVHIVRTGTANLASVAAGVERAGGAPVLTDSPRDAEGADLLVLPGVGSLGAAMEGLRGRGLEEPLRRRALAGRPLLAICLGLHVLLEGSEESPGVPGLGVAAGRAARFPPVARVPQLGWNRVEPGEGGGPVRAGHAYFAHSYRLGNAPAGWGAAHAEYAGRFVAAMWRGGVLACQFHPELSGAWGLALLRRWMARAEGAGTEGAPC